MTTKQTRSKSTPAAMLRAAKASAEAKAKAPAKPETKAPAKAEVKPETKADAKPTFVIKGLPDKQHNGTLGAATVSKGDLLVLEGGAVIVAPCDGSYRSAKPACWPPLWATGPVAVPNGSDPALFVGVVPALLPAEGGVKLGMAFIYHGQTENKASAKGSGCLVAMAAPLGAKALGAIPDKALTAWAASRGLELLPS